MLGPGCWAGNTEHLSKGHQEGLRRLETEQALSYLAYDSHLANFRLSICHWRFHKCQGQQHGVHRLHINRILPQLGADMRYVIRTLAWQARHYRRGILRASEDVGDGCTAIHCHVFWIVYAYEI